MGARDRDQLLHKFFMFSLQMRSTKSPEHLQ